MKYFGKTINNLYNPWYNRMMTIPLSPENYKFERLIGLIAVNNNNYVYSPSIVDENTIKY